MTRYKWEILQTVRQTEMGNKKQLEIKMCGNDNYCEIVCQLFRAPLLLMDLAAVCWKTRTVLIHIYEMWRGGGGAGRRYSYLPRVPSQLH